MLSKQSKILITGATGFVGSYILKCLVQDGYENIYCMNRSSSNMNLVADVRDKAQWIDCDIMDMPRVDEVTQDMEVIIHAASIVSFHTKNKNKLIDTAMTGTANLVNAALGHGKAKFIHISSIAAIGRKRKYEEIDERQIFSQSEFDTTYGLSKFLSEQEVWRGHAEGLPITILNPSMILGAGNWDQSSTQIFKKIYQGMTFYPEGSNGWVDVRDVAQAVLISLKGNFDGQRYIISAENAPYKTIFEKIATQLKVKAPKYALSPFIGGLIQKVETLRSLVTQKPPLLTKETLKSTSVTSVYDNTKSRVQLGLQYRPIDITIQESCQVFLENWPLPKTWASIQ